MESLVDLIYNDTITFLKSNSELLFNERDFQIHLATTHLIVTTMLMWSITCHGKNLRTMFGRVS